MTWPDRYVEQLACHFDVRTFQNVGGCAWPTPFPAPFAGWGLSDGWQQTFTSDGPDGLQWSWLPTGQILAQFVGSDGLVYNGICNRLLASRSWRGFLQAACPLPPLPTAFRRCVLTVDSLCNSATDYMRALVDEVDDGSPTVTHWLADSDLPGFPCSHRINGSSNIWTPNHTRGNIHKLNSISFPRYEVQSQWLDP